MNLGHKIDGDLPPRDAIHIAVIPMILRGDYFSPGEPVCMVYGTTNIVKSAHTMTDAIGVIDPYIEDSLRDGDKVYVYMKPNSITGLRHEWTHAVLDNPHIATNEHEIWIRQFADRYNFDYDELIAEALNIVDHGLHHWRGIIAQGQKLHSAEELGPNHALFWSHLEQLTNSTFSEEHKAGMGWSCSC